MSALQRCMPGSGSLAEEAQTLPVTSEEALPSALRVCIRVCVFSPKGLERMGRVRKPQVLGDAMSKAWYHENRS